MGESVNVPPPEVYQEKVKEKGFVAATAETVTQILANTSRIEGLESAIADLTARLVKLEKKPK